VLFAQIAVAIPNTVSATIVHDGAQRDMQVDRDVDVDVGDQVSLHFRALQTEHATYVVSGLPQAAHATAAEDGVDVLWTPVDRDAGVHDVFLHVTDGEGSADRKVSIAVETTHHGIFVPGAITSVFVPNDSGRLGAFLGGGIELVIYSFLQRGHAWFPSHGRIYLDVEGLISNSPTIEPLVQGILGFDLSLEQSPQRRILLPFLGAEIGVATQKQIGAFGWGMPLAGLYLYASPNARVALKGGYLLPTTGDQAVRGVRISASFDYGWW